MITSMFKGTELPKLAMGGMRLPIVDGNYARIDEVATKTMVSYCMEHGVNYFDTAWGYHDGQSEIALRNALWQYPRESYFLADKFPGYDLSNMDKAGEIFEEQLGRCRVEYFDFYMLHNVCEMNIDAYLDEKYGILAYLLEQKKAGRIRHLGFSAHGGMEVMKRFLNICGDRMEFCQIQLNYLDWTFQSAREKAELLNAANIPIWVMEPLRGGQLAKLSEENTASLKALRPEEDIPAWAFRFLQTLPNVVITLSGMSSYQQVQQNICTYEESKPLTAAEMDVLLGMAQSMVKQIALPCTSCRYCTSHCPQQLDIPGLLELYNEHCFTGGGFIAPMALMAVPKEKQPAACIGCAECEAVCPQQIKVAAAMADFAKRLGA